MSTEGEKSRKFWRAIFLGILLVFSVALTSCTSSALASSEATATAVHKARPITIRISNPNVEIAIARVLGTEQVARLKEGLLALESCSSAQSISVWAPRHYIKTFPCNGNSPFEYPITLDPLSAIDNPNYAWIDAGIHSNPALNCITCHSDLSSGLNEYAEWSIDGHSNVFVDPYFWTMYMGINTYQSVPSPDALGFRSDYPNENGNCAFCHAPATLPALQRGTNLSLWNVQIPGSRNNVETEGITCDVCHKVIDVLIGEGGLPIPERLGVLSLDLLRPAAGELFYIGPWPDHQPGIPENAAGFKHATACSPVFSEGKFCAACHYGKFFDTVIYNSYGEWLNSIYSKKEINSIENQSYRSCQDCHMSSSPPINGSSWRVRSACSPENHSVRDFSHNMMHRDNTGNPVIVQAAATVSIEALKEQGKIKVKVKVVNTRAGHKLPTDSPLRHLILVVQARDRNNALLAQIDGARIPEWGGTGDQPLDYAGQPGVIYANILKDKVTSKVPAVAYWNPVMPAWEGSDTRLLPLQEVWSEYSFVAPSRGNVTITAQLFYRYAFIDIIRQKGWQLQDILINWDDETVEG